MAAQVGGVLLRVLRVEGVEVGGEGDLGVDDDAPPAGQVDHQVGAHEFPAEAGADLGLEVAVADHAAELHDALQLDLAPAAADLRGAQRGDQLVGAVGQAGGRARHRLHLAGQGGVADGAVLLQFAQLPADGAHGLLQADEAGIRGVGGVGVTGTSISMGEPAEDGAEEDTDEKDGQGGTHVTTVSHAPDMSAQRRPNLPNRRSMRRLLSRSRLVAAPLVEVVGDSGSVSRLAAGSSAGVGRGSST